MLKNFLRDEDGQGMVEYGLIIALIAVVVIGALVALGNGVFAQLNAANNALSGAGSGGGSN